MFLTEKHELLAGCTEDRRADHTKSRCGGLQKRAGRAAEKGSHPACLFPQPSLMHSLPARLNV